MERWPCVGERADKLCVGDPGRLSLEDRERFREDRLRLVCSRLDCLVIFLNSELRFLLQEEGRGFRCLSVSRHQRATGSSLGLKVARPYLSWLSFPSVLLFRRAILHL